jgi:hypothetical protein
MPGDDFAPLAGLADPKLAALFGVPVEQVWARRLALARRSPPARPRRERREHQFQRARARARDNAYKKKGGSMSDPTSVRVALGYQLLNRALAVIDQGQERGATPHTPGSLIELRGARRAP